MNHVIHRSLRILVTTFSINLLLITLTHAQQAKLDPRLERLQEQRIEYYDRFFQKLDMLIQSTEMRGMTEATAELKRWQIPVSGDELLKQPLPKLIQPPLPSDLNNNDRQWRVELAAARNEIAKDLYLLSRRVINANFNTIATIVLREVLYFDPDHQQARLQLGFERYADTWTTTYSAKKLKAGFVWHDTFGWLPTAHVSRYENGERCFRTQWMSAEREASIRQSFQNAWEIETDNYRVKTNISHERGVEIAKALETFHAYFKTSFAALFNTPEQLKRNAKQARHFDVHVFRNKEEYVARLSKENQQIGITNGIYMPNDRVAYFFENPDIESTLYHEATHQILYELHSQARQIGEHEHFWIVEAFACYMESFQRTPTGFNVGDPRFIRFQDAYHRVIDDGHLVPLGKFSQQGKLAFQHDPNIQKNYSLGAGYAHFLMHYENGLYRDALIQYLELIYRPSVGRVRIAGLDKLTGTSFDELDRQFLFHIRTLAPKE